MSTASPITYVTPYYPPHVGGLESVAQSIADGMAASRDVTVLTSNRSPEPAPRREQRGRLHVHRLWCREVLRVPFIPMLLWHAWQRARRGAILHVHAPVAFCPEVVWLAAVLSRRPYVVHFHLDADATSRWRWPHETYTRYVLAFVMRRAARVVAVSTDQPQVLTERYGVEPGRIVLVPNGVDPIFRLPERRAFPERGRRFRFLFVGRLAAQKNASLLVRAAARLRSSAEVAIVGDGHERDALEHLARDLDAQNVRFLGRRESDRLVEEYRRADAFVLSSLKESTGIVLLEAMAAGLPVISTDVDGSRTTVGEDGILVDLDPSQMARAMDEVATDPQRWSELARRSSGRSRRHDWAASISALESLYLGLEAPTQLRARRVPQAPGRA